MDCPPTVIAAATAPADAPSAPRPSLPPASSAPPSGATAAPAPTAEDHGAPGPRIKAANAPAANAAGDAAATPQGNAPTAKDPPDVPRDQGGPPAAAAPSAHAAPADNDTAAGTNAAPTAEDVAHVSSAPTPSAGTAAKAQGENAQKTPSASRAKEGAAPYGSCVAVPRLPSKRAKFVPCKQPGCGRTAAKGVVGGFCARHATSPGEQGSIGRSNGDKPTTASEEDEPASHAKEEPSACKFSGGCTAPATIGGHCQSHYDALMEEADLLSNLFCSSAASASGESAGEEDAQAKEEQLGDDNVPSPALNRIVECVKELEEGGGSTQEGAGQPRKTEVNPPPYEHGGKHCTAKPTVQRALTINASPEVTSQGKPSPSPRELPADALAYLRKWLISKQHFEHPYPTDKDMILLGAVTGLDKTKLKNWFVNNRRRVWRPMMIELRHKHGLTASEAIPPHVLEALDDAPDAAMMAPSTTGNNQPPPPPYPGTARPVEAASAEADSDAAAAMILMNGSSRAPSPAEEAVRAPSKAEPKRAAEEVEGNVQAVNSVDERIASKGLPVTPKEVVASLAARAAAQAQKRKDAAAAATAKPLPKKQIKLNVGGTIVQLPSDILLKHPASTIATIARSAMKVGDMAVPIAHDYELFRHCVFYLCNDKVTLPPAVNRKDFLREMKYFGIPYDTSKIAGGFSVPLGRPVQAKKGPAIKNDHVARQQISPTTVAQLHQNAEAKASPSSESPPSTLDSQSAGEASPAEVGGRAKAPSPLDFLSAVVSTSQSFSPEAAHPAPATSASTDPIPGLDYGTMKKSPCGSCEACIMEDCGACKNCRDKVKFGGRGKLRKKCERRKCPHMTWKPLSAKSAKEAAKKGRVLRGGAPAEAQASERPVEPPTLSLIATEQRWHENLEYLLPCIQHGSLNYTVIADEDVRSRVKNFVKEQRNQFRKSERGEKTSMTDERLQLLKRANFPFTHKHFVAHKYFSSNELSNLATKATAADAPSSKPTSSLDALCMITSQSFDAMDNDDGVGMDNSVGDGSDEEEAPESRPRSPSSSESSVALDNDTDSEEASVQKVAPVVVNGRHMNCNKCAACVRDDCGECRHCLDKPKFGGPGVRKSRCLNRTCLTRLPKEDGEPSAEPADAKDGNGKASKSEEARMKAELARIKRELDARASRSVGRGRSSSRLDELLREAEEEESDDEEGSLVSHEDDESGESDSEEETDSDDSESEDMDDGETHPSDELCNAVYRKALAAGSKKDKKDSKAGKVNCSNLPRGVTIRPSGKWQVQLYYAGFSRYIGLFDTKEEAASAYENARECCDSFTDEDPSPQRIKKNLDLVRKAAFTGGNQRKRQQSAQSKKRCESKKPAAKSQPKKAKTKPKPPVPPPSRKRKERDGNASMKDELARVKAELEAKEMGAKLLGMKYYYKPPPKPLPIARPIARPAAKPIARPAAVAQPPAAKRRRVPNPVPKVPTQSAAPTKRTSNSAAMRAKIEKEKEAEAEQENIKRKLSDGIYDKAKKLAGELPRGITVRPSGKWQVQLYYAGKSRYLGVYDSKLDATVAYELSREYIGQVKGQELRQEPTAEEVKKNITSMRNAAFRFIHEKRNGIQHSNKKPKTSTAKKTIPAVNTAYLPPVAKSVSVAPKSEAAVAAKLQRAEQTATPAHGQVKGNSYPAPTAGAKLGPAATTAPTVPSTKSIVEMASAPKEEEKRPTRQRQQRTVAAAAAAAAGQQIPNVAPPSASNTAKDSGHSLEALESITSKEQERERIRRQCVAEGCTKYKAARSDGYCRTCFEAKQEDVVEEAEEIEESLPQIGPGWKVKIVSRKIGKGKDYYYYSPSGQRFRSMQSAKDHAIQHANRAAASQQEPAGIITKDLTEIGPGWTVTVIPRKAGKGADYYYYSPTGEKFRSMKEVKSAVSSPRYSQTKAGAIGSVGYQFRKRFPDGKWYDGVVVKILNNCANGYDRRCHYPEDDDFEDLSLDELCKLAENSSEVEAEGENDMLHNDLCESCGNGGELLCCSTCNLVFHLGCTRPMLSKLPPDDWSCAFCVASGDVKGKSKQEQQTARLAVKEIEILKDEAGKREGSLRKSSRARKSF